MVGKLLLRVAEPARILEAALGRLDPVAAELGLLEAGGHWHQRARHLVVVRVEVVLIGDALSAAKALAFLRAALEDVRVIVVGWDEIASRHLECSLGEGHCNGTGAWCERWRLSSHCHRGLDRCFCWL